LVRELAVPLAALVQEVGGQRAPWLPGYRVKILDGNYLARTQHRLRELRGTRAAALPGMSVVVLDPQAGLAVDYFPCGNGHAQERALLPAVAATVQPGEVWIGDRNFCTPAFLAAIAERGGAFLIRQHRSTLTWEAVTAATAQGRTATGRVEEQQVRLTNVPGTPVVRRLRLVLDTPTRDGETEIVVLTNLPPEAATAVHLLDVYRRRWTIEGFFQEVTLHLASEIATLGYPPAALFAFAVALLTSNVLAVVKGALRAVHGADRIDQEVSGYYLAAEVASTYRGMLIALPPATWEPLRTLPVAALAAWWRRLAGQVRLAAFRKHPRGPKKPAPPRPPCGRHKHVATAKLIAQRKSQKRTP
jgi:hypothetical protein